MPIIELLQYKSNHGVYNPACKHHVPAAAHHVARLLKVCDLVAGETYFTSSGDSFACFYVLRHCSTFTWQQRMTKTGRRGKVHFIKRVSNIYLKNHKCKQKKVICAVNTYAKNVFAEHLFIPLSTSMASTYYFHHRLSCGLFC